MAHRFLLAQLVVPAFLWWIGFDAFQQGYRGRVSQALMIAGAAWAATGLALFVMRARATRRSAHSELQPAGCGAAVQLLPARGWDFDRHAGLPKRDRPHAPPRRAPA